MSAKNENTIKPDTGVKFEIKTDKPEITKNPTLELNMKCLFCYKEVEKGFLPPGGSVCAACANERKTVDWSQVRQYEKGTLEPEIAKFTCADCGTVLIPIRLSPKVIQFNCPRCPHEIQTQNATR